MQLPNVNPNTRFKPNSALSAGKIDDTGEKRDLSDQSNKTDKKNMNGSFRNFRDIFFCWVVVLSTISNGTLMQECSQLSSDLAHIVEEEHAILDTRY